MDLSTYDTHERYIAQIIRCYQGLDFTNSTETAVCINDIFISPQSEVEIQHDLRAVKERARKYQVDSERRHAGKERPEKITRHLPINQALAENLKIVVLGGPGSGKTTILKYITLAFAENQPERLGLQETRLPIFIHLYDYAVKRAEWTDNRFSLLDHLDVFINAQLELNMPTDFFTSALERGDCCLCLDGLDELTPAGLRREAASAITALANRYPRNRFIVTSRSVGYEDAPLERREFAHQTIRPFNQNDILLFVEKWYTAHEMAPQPHITHLTKTILEQERIRSLAANPLMLTIIALVHRVGAELPYERARLYDQCVTLLVEAWTLHGTKYNLRRRLLEKLAYWIHSQPGVPAAGAVETQLRTFLENDPKLQLDEEQVQREVDEFLALVKMRSGLLVERGPGLYTFAHISFQEFLAACDIEKRLAHSSDALWDEISPRLHDAHWREVILLLLGLLNRFEQHNTELVGRIYQTSDPYEALLHRHLLLAARALADQAEVQTDLRNQIVDALLTLAASQELAGWDAFAPLGALHGDRRAAAGLLALAQDPKATVGMRLFAAQALGHLGRADEESDVLLALAHDEKVHPDVRSAATQAMGQLGHTGPLVLNGLLALAQDEKVYTYVRSDAVQVLGQLGEPQPAILDGLLALAQDKMLSERIRRAAVQALGRLGNTDKLVLNSLLTMAQDEKTDNGVRSTAAHALGQLGHADEKVLSGLIALAEDEKVDQGIRCDAAEALGQLGWVDHATSVLLALARDERANAWVRSDAADVLTQMGREEEAANVLLALAQDEKVDARLRSDAADALAHLAHVDEAIVSSLLKLAQDEKTDVRLRSDTAQTLTHLGHTDEAVGVLTTLAWDQTAGFWVRSDAAQALGQLDHPVAADVLLALARDPQANAGAHSAAVQALEHLGHADELVLNGLLALAQDEKFDAGVRSDAVQALGQLGRADETILNSLLALLQDAKVDASVHSAAAQALGELRRADEAVLNGLLDLVRDEKVDAWVRKDATQALGQLGHADKAVLNSLLALAQDEKARLNMRNAAYHSLKTLLEGNAT